MKKSEELRAQAAGLLEKARKVKDDAEANGGYTQEKRNEVSTIFAEMDEKLAEAKEEERFEAASGEIAPEERGQRLPQRTVVEEEDVSEEERTAAEMVATPEYRAAFLQYARLGEGGLNAEQHRMMNEARALTEGVDADGGYLAPEQLVVAVEREAQDLELLAPRMEVINTSVRRIGFNREDEADLASWGWISELQAKPEDQPTFERYYINVHVAGGIIRVSDELLEDAQFNLESYLAVIAAERRTEINETAYLSGTGTGQPFGILNRLNGEAGTPNRFTTSTIGAIVADDLVRAYYSLKRRFRRNASWVFGSQAIVAARLLKDGNDQYMWAPGLTAGEEGILLGKPVIDSPELALDNPVSGGNDIGLVGDLRRYRILRRLQMQVKRLEELYAATDEVGFRFRWREGGDVRTFDAFKTLRVRAS